MKPFKNLMPVALWALRLTIALAVYVRFFEIVKTLNYSSISFLVAALFCLFAILLVAGGLGKKHGLTMLSGLFIGLLSGWQLAQMPMEPNNTVSFYALLAAAGIFFLANGNRK